MPLPSLTYHPAESQWLHLPLIKDLTQTCRSVFPVAHYGFTTIPTYPSGQLGFMVCSKDAKANVREPLRRIGEDEEMKLYRYYSADIHRVCFVLPGFAKKELGA